MKKALIIPGLILLGGLIWVYSVYNPAFAGFFPKCPFRSLTGWLCPGCGSQRAVHFLLNGQIGSAFRVNPLLVISIPYLALGFLLRTPVFPAGVRQRLASLYEGKAVWIAGLVVVMFWVGRNMV